MRLDSTDGAELEIVPSRYEYAGTAVDQLDLDWGLFAVWVGSVGFGAVSGG